MGAAKRNVSDQLIRDVMWIVGMDDEELYRVAARAVKDAVLDDENGWPLKAFEDAGRAVIDMVCESILEEGGYGLETTVGFQVLERVLGNITKTELGAEVIGQFDEELRESRDGWEEWRLVKGDGMAGFLCPPGHVHHRWHVEQYEAPGISEPLAIASVESALAEENIPDVFRERLEALVAGQALVLSPLWVQSVYGYYRGIEEDRAAAHIRRFFPDYDEEPMLGVWGQEKCRHCGDWIQYEPRHDAWTVYGKTPRCPVNEEGHER